jgi:hypothetical protein
MVGKADWMSSPKLALISSGTKRDRAPHSSPGGTVGAFSVASTHLLLLIRLSVEQGFRILSSYRLSDNTRIWIITEADRSSTCILLPEEY